jgi:hypothetical protein
MMSDFSAEQERNASSPIRENNDAKTIDSSDRQSANAEFPILSIRGGREMDLRDAQPENGPASIARQFDRLSNDTLMIKLFESQSWLTRSTVAGTSKLFSDQHPAKTKLSIRETFTGATKLIDSREAQCAKQ